MHVWIMFISSTYTIVNELRENKIALKQTNLKQLPALFPRGLGKTYTGSHITTTWAGEGSQVGEHWAWGSWEVYARKTATPVDGEPGPLWTAQ